MPDLHDFLDHEARRVRSEQGALGAVLSRASRRRRTKRIATTVLALSVASAGFGLAYAAFRPAREAVPAGLPIPGPSVSATPGSVPITVSNQTATEGVAEFAAAVLSAQGTDVIVADESRTYLSDTTSIRFPPSREGQVIALRDRFFPNAELRPPTDPAVIHVAVGADFVRRNADLFQRYAVVRSFMTRRLEGSGAEAFLSDDAVHQYETGEDGLFLYDGVVHASFFSIQEITWGQGDTAVAVVTAGDRTERLTVGPPHQGRPEIVAAELVPPDPYEEVRAFVRGFLKARRDASGAGTYLGEDAREAYASHVDGLDLLRYAADRDLIETRIVKYDRLSTDRHQVVVAFTVARASGEPGRTFELLTIERLGEDGFVVADAERWDPG